MVVSQLVRGRIRIARIWTWCQSRHVPRRVGLGVQKLGHRCALNLWKGPGREPGEDKEGIRIRVERPDCNRMAWEDSGLPSLRTESQVDSSGKYCSAITNRHRAVKRGSL